MDPSETTRLNRKRDEAEFKLAKAEAEDDGEDFERKRAWDWTIEESERWDKRTEKKKKHVEDVAFQGLSHHHHHLIYSSDERMEDWLI